MNWRWVETQLVIAISPTLVFNQEALKGFKSNIDDNIEKADANWRLLTGP